ncbi:GPI biosynthesis protein family Pig-F-domain-containing protein [Scleroderma yunnanense]
MPPKARVSKASTKTRDIPKPLYQDSFPYFQYVSIVGVHTTLVGFTAFYLPQSIRLLGPLPIRTADRPQSEFMEALTSRPTLTAGWICAGLCVLQLWWGGWVRKWCFEQSVSSRTVDEIRMERAKFNERWFVRLREAIVFTLFVTVVAHIVIILFGAPLASHHLHTGFLAFAIALMTVLSPAYALSSPSLASDTPAMVSRLNWVRLFAELSPRNAIERAIVYPAIGTVLGAWFGAFPIALDWDRPWQVGARKSAL